MDNFFQILKLSWDIQEVQNGTNSKYDIKPYFTIKKFNSNQTERYDLIAGKEIKFFVSEEQYCIGYEKSRGEWINCPFNSQTEQGNLQCDVCEQVDFFSCRASCIGMQCYPKTPRAKAICDRKETYLYLTFVGGKYKVGVSLNPLRRWLDQGSIYGTVLYKGYGLETRFYEQTIGGTLDLKLSVHTNDKIAFLGEKLPSERSIKVKFSEYFYQIKKLNLFLSNEEIKINSLLPYYQNIAHLRVKPIIDNKLIKGKIIGVIGKLLVVQDKNSYYVSNIQALMGKKCSFEKPENGINYAKQRTFYDF